MNPGLPSATPPSASSPKRHSLLFGACLMVGLGLLSAVGCGDSTTEDNGGAGTSSKGGATAGVGGTNAGSDANPVGGDGPTGTAGSGTPGGGGEPTATG